MFSCDTRKQEERVRELTVGTPVVDCDKPLQEGWVEVNCQVCKQRMRCLEMNYSEQRIADDELVVICYKCIPK